MKSERSSRPLYPVNLDISGKRCLVVGGGSVAARKIRALLLCGGVVQIISPEADAAIAKLAETGEINWLKRTYKRGDVKDAFLIFAATDDPEVQRQVSEDAGIHHVLLNSAADPELSDFHVPAKIRRGDFVIAVSTGGGSPALATLLRAQLAEEYGDEYGILVELMARIRSHVVKGSSVAAENRSLFKSILQLPVLHCIKTGNWNELKLLLSRVLPAGIDGDQLVDELRRDMDKQPLDR